jgi:hypothetical protein
VGYGAAGAASGESTTVEKKNLNEKHPHPRDDLIKFHDPGNYYTDAAGDRFRLTVTGLKALFTDPFDQ